MVLGASLLKLKRALETISSDLLISSIKRQIRGLWSVQGGEVIKFPPLPSKMARIWIVIWMTWMPSVYQDILYTLSPVFTVDRQGGGCTHFTGSA